MNGPPTTIEIAAASAWPRLRWLPAWLVSVVFHLVVAIAAALLIGRAARQVGLAEPDRAGAIALVARDGQQRQYFSDSDASETAAAASAAAAASTDGGSPADLPDAGSPPLLDTVALPELPGAISGSGLEMVAPQTGSGRRGPVLPAGIDDAAILAADAAIPREAIPTGPTAKLALFGSQAAEGRSFVFVIDRSQSMGGDGLGAIQAAAAELKRQIGALSDEQRVQVIAYNQATAFLSGRELIPATEENKQRLTAFVADTAAFGQTEHARALLAALKLKPEVIFLLTDGGDPHPNLADLRAIRDAAAGRTSIHTLHFGRGEADSAAAFLSRLASENRGSYTFIDMSSR